MAVFAFPLLTREHAEGRGGNGRLRMGMCGDPWKDMRTASLWFLHAPISIVTRVPVVS